MTASVRQLLPSLTVLEPTAISAPVCFRCGSFLTAESRLIDARSFCVACASRPDVDYLETFRLKYWGKRDAWAWLFGVGSISSVAMFVSHLLKGELLPAATSLFAVTVAVSFFLGLRWARPGLVVSLVVNVGLNFVVGDFDSAARRSGAYAAGEAFGAAVGALIIPLLIVAAILNDTRNRLFFKLEVPRPKLEKAWGLYANNAIARTGLLVAILSLVVLPLGPIALLMSVIGLRHVDPAAHPPIGRKGQAIAGLVLSSLSTLGGAVLLARLIASSG